MNIEVNFKKRKVIFVRHAESQFNALYDKDGTQFTDDPAMLNCQLTEKGVEQAKRLKENIGQSKFDLIICSPLLRTIDTYKHSSFTSEREILITELCREEREHYCDFLPGEEIIIEKEGDVFGRVEQFKEMIRALDQDINTVCVFTHSSFIWHATAHKGKDGDWYGKWIDNAEWVEVEI